MNRSLEKSVYLRWKGFGRGLLFRNKNGDGMISCNWLESSKKKGGGVCGTNK